MGKCNNGGNCNSNGFNCIFQLFLGFLVILFFIGIGVYLYNQYVQTQHTTAMLQAAAMRSVTTMNAVAVAPHTVPGATVLPVSAAAAAVPPGSLAMSSNLCGRAVTQGGPFGSCVICGCDIKEKFVSCCGHLGRGTTYYGNYCVPEGCGVAA